MRRVTLRVREGMFIEALDRLAGQQSIPIGWEISQNELLSHDINVDFHQAPLKDVLDHLVLADPSYRWRLEDGIINFYPAFNRDERLEELLSLRIKEFNPPTGLSVFGFRDAILGLPEVDQFLSAKGLEASHGGNCCSGPVPTVSSEIREANIEVRALLNKLVRDGHFKMWALSRAGESRDLVVLSL